MPLNVLLITSHDTGRHLGCYGVSSVHTPNLDHLAGEGCRFTRYFAAATVCSPSRGAMMTGRYPQRNGMIGLCHMPWGWNLNPGEKHLSHLMHEAGYYTALFGHQHETRDIDAELCFDEHGFHRDPATSEHLPCDQVAPAVGDFLAGRAGERQPFYLQVGFFETHQPYDFGGATADDEHGVVIPPWIVDNDAGRQEMAAFQGNLRKMDAAVGQILRSLDDAGLAEQTIVIYTTDHGLALPRAKATLHEAGTEISLLMRQPGRIEAGSTCDALLSNVDFTPTVLEMCGIDRPDNLDGRSFAGAFAGEPVGREAVFAEFGGHGAAEYRAVRTDRHRLIRSFQSGREFRTPVDLARREQGRNLPFVRLYDLEADPLEFHDLAEDPACAEIRADLDRRLRAWMADVGDPLLEGPIATPYYRSAMADFTVD